MERVEVLAYPEEWFHLHGKALSGLRHSHPLKDGEDPDKPWHYHEGENGPRLLDVDRRGGWGGDLRAGGRFAGQLLHFDPNDGRPPFAGSPGLVRPPEPRRVVLSGSGGRGHSGSLDWHRTSRSTVSIDPKPLVLRADARALPLPDESIDLIVTSPPYYTLRSYTDGGEHYAGQIGSEVTPQEWLANLLDCTREMVRVLKPSGSIWVDLGDKYGGRGGGPQGDQGQRASRTQAATYADRRISIGRDKSLMLLPERYRIACVDQLGLIARAVVVWSKPNGLPESVTDRVRRSHEDWVHLTKQPRYFSAVDEIREPASNYARPRDYDRGARNGSPKARSFSDSTNPLGALPGSVWTIPTEPLTVPDHLGVDHFAAFPTEWPRRIILGWSPSGICVECGEGRRPVVQVQAQPGLAGEPIETRRHEPSGEQAINLRQFISAYRERAGLSRADVSEKVVGSRSGACWNWEHGLKLPSPRHWRELKRVLNLPSDWDHVMLDTYMRPSGTLSRDRTLDGAAGRHLTRGSTGLSGVDYRKITGYACACPEPTAHTRPAVVLDPFGGTGTTALVAQALGRVGISVDMSADYCRLARWRVNDPGERAKAMRVDKPAPVAESQLQLWGPDEAT